SDGTTTEPQSWRASPRLYRRRGQLGSFLRGRRDVRRGDADAVPWSLGVASPASVILRSRLAYLVD
ncbi:MAG: hypothetical protein OXU75_12500, partial [Deltaproteobacteria bacterium]|nr:hypothetical protein [Deltaproteobacteria bacterium]